MPIYQEDVGFHIVASDHGLRVAQVSMRLNVIQGEDMILNKVTGIVKGQYGNSIQLQVVDDEGNAENISSYTTLTVRAVSPDGRTTLEFTAAKVNSGTNGEFSFSPTSNNTFDRDGTWQAQLQLAATNILAPTVVFEIEVDKKL